MAGGEWWVNVTRHPLPARLINRKPQIRLFRHQLFSLAFQLVEATSVGLGFGPFVVELALQGFELPAHLLFTGNEGKAIRHRFSPYIYNNELGEQRMDL